MTGAEVLRLEGVKKRFGNVEALKNANLQILTGEIHALVGENGAGKSTLIKSIVGIHRPDDGHMFLDGEAHPWMSVHEARQAGIRAVFQEFSLVPDLSIEANLFLGREPARFGIMRRSEMRRLAVAHLEELGFSLDLTRLVSSLSRAEQQMVEIAKALMGNVKVLILDEPTASLSKREADRLFELLASLQARKVGILYVSHRMDEIRRISQRITVLRDGLYVDNRRTADVSDSEVVELMIGRKLDVLFPAIAGNPGETLLDIRNLTTARGEASQVNIELRAGEVVGLAGLMGCGNTEVARTVFGLEQHKSGEILVKGQQLDGAVGPMRMLELGVCYFPSDRAREGLALERPIRENASMAALETKAFTWHGILRTKNEKSLVASAIDRLGLRPANIEAVAGSLSGGNQQKVVLSRASLRPVDVFFFDEPTVGIDVGAKSEVYRLIGEAVASGAAVLLISSDLMELVHLSHRAYVMHEGRVLTELTGDELTETNVLATIFSSDDNHASN